MDEHDQQHGDGRLARLSAADERTWVLRPGACLGIGRHPENDIVLRDSRVSRFHARLEWARHDDRPQVRDLNSQNGLELGGRPVLLATLPLQGTLSVGGVELDVRLESCEEAPCVLNDDDDDGTLPLPWGQGEEGPLAGSPGELWELLLRVEREGSTGTLRILSALDGVVELAFCEGRLRAARCGGLRGVAALEILLGRSSWSEYRMLPGLEREDGDPLELWASDLRWRLRPGRETQRLPQQDRHPAA